MKNPLTASGRSWGIRIIRREGDLGAVGQTVFPFLNAIDSMTVGCCEDEQAWPDASEVSVMDFSKMGPNLNGVPFAVLSVRPATADALQVHLFPVGVFVRGSAFRFRIVLLSHTSIIAFGGFRQRVSLIRDCRKFPAQQMNRGIRQVRPVSMSI
jgi:hypothetical protein